MKSTLALICLCLTLAVVVAAPPTGKSDAEILKLSTDVRPDGYSLELQTSDGTSRKEQATLKNPGTDDESLSVKGQYSYVGSDGVTYTVDFVADENGYQPQGAHLPTI